MYNSISNSFANVVKVSPRDSIVGFFSYSNKFKGSYSKFVESVNNQKFVVVYKEIWKEENKLSINNDTILLYREVNKRK